jgi:hypothetical protein
MAVPYRLKYDPAVEAVHDSLPATASQELTTALAAACDDPMSATRPYNGIDDGVMRKLTTRRVTVSLFIAESEKTISVLQIDLLP